MSESFSRASRSAREMARMLLRWLVLALPIGLLCGGIGTAFHLAVEAVTELRGAHGWLLWLLPLCWSWSRRRARRTISNGRNASRCPCMTYYLRRTMVNQTERSQSHGDSRKEVQCFVLLYKTQIP